MAAGPWAQLFGGSPVRAVTLAGLFTSTDAAWVHGPAGLPTDPKALEYHWTTFVGADDFAEMKKIGLNTVKIPIPVSFFSSQASTGLIAVARTTALAQAVGLEVIALTRSFE